MAYPLVLVLLTLSTEGMTAGRNYCWLKSVGATTKNPYGGMGGEGKAFSAPVLREEEQGYDYYGHDIKSYNSATLTKADCIQHCKQTEACARWMYIEKFSGERNYCWLKDEGATSRTRYGGEGSAFSGPVYRDEEEGWDYYGNDVDYVEDGTKEQCRRLCDENQDCKVWLFIANGEVEGNVLKVGKGRCWVKNKIGTQTEWKGEGVAFSALKSVCRDAPDDEDCKYFAIDTYRCTLGVYQHLLYKCKKTCGLCQ